MCIWKTDCIHIVLLSKALYNIAWLSPMHAHIHTNVNKLGLQRQTHHFLSGPQHAQLPKAHVERWALEGPVGLLDHDNVDGARQRGLVDALVQFLHRHQQLAHVVHGLHLEEQPGNNAKAKLDSVVHYSWFRSLPQCPWTRHRAASP